MDLLDALIKLKNQNPGNYVSLRQELTSYRDGKLVAEYMLYIDGVGHIKGSSWESAFALLDQEKLTKEKC